MDSTNINKKVFVKKVTLEELTAMELIIKYTNIKIPKIYNTVKNNDGIFIHMEYIEGQILGSCLENMDETRKEKIKKQLENIFIQIRKIPNPYKYYVCSSIGGPIKDHRIDTDDFVGPFNTEDEFNKKIGNNFNTKSHKSVFTHADIKPHNIILGKDDIITIIDWECAGWYPEYWEYTKSLFNINTYVEWINLMTSIFTEYKEDLDREKNILKTYVYF